MESTLGSDRPRRGPETATLGSLSAPLGVQELVETAHAGQAPRCRGGLEAAGLEIDQEGPERAGIHGVERGPRPGEVTEIILQIAPVGGQGVEAGTALGGQHVEIVGGLGAKRPAGIAGDVRPAQRLPGWSFEAGMETVISRGVGWTKFAKANIAAKTRPARIARVAKKRNRVGTSVEPRADGRWRREGGRARAVSEPPRVLGFDHANAALTRPTTTQRCVSQPA